MSWDELIFGIYGQAEIQRAVKDGEWQDLRVSMKGTPLRKRFDLMKTHLSKKGYSRQARVQVTNYVNALKRGGMI